MLDDFTGFRHRRAGVQSSSSVRFHLNMDQASGASADIGTQPGLMLINMAAAWACET